MGLARAARARFVKRRAAVGLVALAVAGAGAQTSGLAEARAAQGTGPAPVVSAVAWRGNTGATHSPEVERMLAGGPERSREAGQGAVPAGDLLGVDVSSLNHPGGAPIDWAEVAASGYRFAFIKATEGAYYENPYYASDAAAAKAAGLLTAAYHFAIPNNSSGTLQADLAVDAAGDPAAGGSTLPLILDIEYDPYVSEDRTNECYGLSPAAMVSWIGAFTAEVARRTGQPPVIYTTSDWWDKCTASSAVFSADPLWIASYGRPASLPPGWTAFSYWQFTSTAKVPGISVRTDASYFSPATLAAAQPAAQSDATGTTASLPVRSLAATDGSAVSYTAAGLPPGLTIGAQTGVITGTLPAAPGSYPVTLTLTGPESQAQELTFTWQVHTPVRLLWPGRQADAAGTPVSVQLTAPDGVPGCSLVFTATGLPPGLAIGPCGRITGIPTRPGTYQPAITAGDSASDDLAATTTRWTITRSPVTATGTIRLALAGTSECLASRPGSSGPAARIWACDRSAGQRWNLTGAGAVDQAGKCLAAITLADGTPAVSLRSCTSRLAQIWQQTADGGLASALTGQCLTEPKITPPDGTAITITDCDGTARQSWTLPPGPLTPELPGQCLAKKTATLSQPARAVLTRCRNTPAQRWTITPAGTIRYADLCLDTGQAPAAGTPVALTACGTVPGQQWQPLPTLATTPATVASTTGSTGALIVNPATGLCLNAPDTTAAPLTLAYCVTSFPRQTWRTS
jgi:lysozyme